MTKIVTNRCFGGFSLSHEAIMRYAELAGFPLYPYVYEGFSKTARVKPVDPQAVKSSWMVSYSKIPVVAGPAPKADADTDYFYDRGLERDDPILVRVVEELGEKANGECAELDVTEIPDGVVWEIDNYDGWETVHENHRSW